MIALFFFYDLILKIFHSLGKKKPNGKYLSFDFSPFRYSWKGDATNPISGKYEVTTALKCQNIINLVK